MPQKLIIDADPGIEDAFAVLVALADPSLEVVGLTATAGAVSGQQATRNLQFLMETVDPVKHPRIGASSLPATVSCSEEPPIRHSFPGKHGLGDIDVVIPDLHNRRESAKLIVDLTTEFPGEVRILSLGPLSNIATAIELDPEFPQRTAGIICLGGTDCGSGDVSAVSEFNISSDPEAAAIVFDSVLPKTLVPLNVSGNSALTFDDVNELTDLICDATHGTLLSSLLKFHYRVFHQLALEGIPLHAVTALAVAAKAEQFSVEPVRADVETGGRLTRGMTVIDRRQDSHEQSNIDIVSSVDAHGIVDYFSRGLRRIAG